MNILEQEHNYYLGIQNSFERAIHTYDHEAIVQLQASNLLIDYLVQIRSSPKKVLDLGCGTGLITAHLAKAFHISSLHINDFSQSLLTRACQRLQPFHPEGLLFNFDQQWDCKGLYDLIFSNMAFQWSLDIHKVFEKCYGYLEQNAILAFSLPLKGSFFELNPDKILPLHTFDDICQSLSNVGFHILKADQSFLYQEFKTHFQALKSIKGCGANYIPQNSRSKMIERSKLNIPSTLTYKIGIFIVMKSLKNENFYNRY